MSPVAVFFRTLLKSSAIFIGAAAIFLNPALEWRAGHARDRRRARGTAVGAAQAGSEAAVDGLIARLKDTDAGVRRAAAHALAQLNSRRAVPALAAALKDADADMRAVDRRRARRAWRQPCRARAARCAQGRIGHHPRPRRRPRSVRSAIASRSTR